MDVCEFGKVVWYSRWADTHTAVREGEEGVRITIMRIVGSSVFEPQYMVLQPCCFAMVASVSSHACLSSPDLRSTSARRGRVATSATASGIMFAMVYVMTKVSVCVSEVMWRG